jgi:hypothetical protein
MLHLATATNTAPPEKTRPNMNDVIDTARGRAPLQDVFHEEEAVGNWRGLEAYRYALDAAFGRIGNRSVRGVVMQSGEKLYSCRLIGEVKDQVHPLFLDILDRLKVPGMKEK